MFTADCRNKVDIKWINLMPIFIPEIKFYGHIHNLHKCQSSGEPYYFTNKKIGRDGMCRLRID